MAAAVTAATCGATAAALGQQVDHLPLQQGGVGIQDDQVLGPAVQPGRLHREVDLAAGAASASARRSRSTSAPATDSS